MKYPISVQDFEKLITGKYVYVDKTDLVYELAQLNVCFLSRPRRFGKSLLISTLEAYFTGKKDLFKGLKMDELEKDWTEYPVFRIDFAGGNYNNPNELEDKLEEILCCWEAKYGKNPDMKTLSGRFMHLIQTAEEQTGHKAVILVDEYDKPLLDVLGTEQEQKNRETLKGFYGTFKAADRFLRFVFLTGVTKFSQVSVFSGFNQPDDISMDSQYDSICGITEEELDLYFGESINEMAKTQEYTPDEMRKELKKQYDGYHFSQSMLDIYNPFSIINALKKKSVEAYWYESGTPTYLARLLEGHKVNMQKLTGKLYSREYFIDYRADKEDSLAMLYQSGYLTIKDYDKRRKVYRLDFPNDEVRKGFVSLIGNSYFHKPSEDNDNWVLNVDDMLRECDLDGVHDAFKSFLASIPYEANKDERAKDFETHFSYTFYIIFRLLSCYTTLIEKQNSKGRADVIIETDNDVFIFEFKLDGSAEEALAQIEEKQYAVPYLDDRRKVHKIGVNISSESRTVDQWLVVE